MRIGAVVGVGDAGILHQSDAVADDPDGLSKREGIGEDAHAPYADVFVQQIITQAQVEELYEVACLVEETVFEEVFQYGFVVLVRVVAQVGVFLAQHPHTQQESASVGGIQPDDVAVNVGSLQQDIIDDQSQGQKHGLEQRVVVGLFDFLRCRRR